MIKQIYEQMVFAGSREASIVTSLAVMLLSGFLLTRITKKLRLPNVTGYITAGILIGPYVFNLVPQNILEGTSFLPDIALSFIAFSTGEFFRIDTLKKNGMKVVVITIFEALVASIAVFIILYTILGLPLTFSLILAALASATAPASTLMTIRQTGAHGDFVNTLLEVVAMDDVVALIAYSVAISVAIAKSGSGDPSFGAFIEPILTNFLVLALGALFGFLMKPLLATKRSTDNRLIIAIAFLFAFCGVCNVLGISPLLGCMSMGMVYINVTDDSRLFKQLNYFSPPILLLFFVRSGANFNLSILFSPSGSIGKYPLIIVGVAYFFFRIIGKYAGAFLGCLLVGKDKKVRNNLGFALIPQAGVAIGLAALGARTLGGELGAALETIILSSSVLYELVGPASAKLALYLSGSYGEKSEEEKEADKKEEQKRSQMELILSRLEMIEKELPHHGMDNDELAFTLAAEEQYLSMSKPVGMKERNSKRRGGAL